MVMLTRCINYLENLYSRHQQFVVSIVQNVNIDKRPEIENFIDPEDLEKKRDVGKRSVLG